MRTSTNNHNLDPNLTLTLCKVVDVDDFNGDDVIGRCYCSIEKACEAMKTNEPIVLSLGER